MTTTIKERLKALVTRKPVGDGERATGLRRGHLADLDTTPERVAEDIARAFHEAYESLAPQFGYETREDSRVPWDEVPGRNRALMVKTVEALFELGVITPTAPLLRWLDEQAKATRDEHGNFRSGYDEGRFDAFAAVEAHLGATELEDRAFTEPDECDHCRAFRDRDWDTVGRLQEERGGPDKACRCDSWEGNHD